MANRGGKAPGAIVAMLTILALIMVPVARAQIRKFLDRYDPR
jgi:hypothetical protein